MKIKPGHEKAWESGIEYYKDRPYERTWYEFTTDWADALEAIIDSGVDPEFAITNNVKKIFDELNEEHELTIYQKNVVFNMMEQIWFYGEYFTNFIFI